MKVALVHYWVKTMRGGEKVLDRLCRLYPEADLYTHVFDPGVATEAMRARTVRETFIGRLPFADRLCETAYLPLTPMALRRLDLTGYDLVISSEAAPAKGAITRPDALHLCYSHSPMRFIWDMYDFYRETSGPIASVGLRTFAPMLRRWDRESASRVDAFVANSAHTRQRIRNVYDRDATIVHPPVDVDAFAPAKAPSDAPYLFLGALTPYKRADLAVEAFRKLGGDRRLVVMGAGEALDGLRREAPTNVEFTGWASDDAVRKALATCRALIFPGEEDFGIVPVEAAAAGRPVIAYRAGGALETVLDGETGGFFDEPSATSLAAAIEAFEAVEGRFDPAAAAAHAARFSGAAFDRGMLAAVEAGFADLKGRATS